MTAYALARLERKPLHADVLRYMELLQGTLNPFGGRFLVHGNPIDVREGEWDRDLVIIEFPDLDRARSWYDSPAYQDIKSLRTDHLNADLILVEGVGADHDPARLAANIRQSLLD